MGDSSGIDEETGVKVFDVSKPKSGRLPIKLSQHSLQQWNQNLSKNTSVFVDVNVEVWLLLQTRRKYLTFSIRSDGTRATFLSQTAEGISHQDSSNSGYRASLSGYNASLRSYGVVGPFTAAKQLRLSKSLFDEGAQARPRWRRRDWCSGTHVCGNLVNLSSRVLMTMMNSSNKSS